ncbi:MAG TPA: ABC transporter permease [Candidatus Acidoferrum sp.]|nr:ABC transporter permease [Candidatus Acidoferrum sp.]
MKGAIPVCKRDLRKFVRQPVMMVAVVLIPLINLVLLGSAFGGAITHAPIAIVRDSYGPLSSSLIGILQNQQSCLFGGTNCQNSFNLENVADLQTAQSMLKEGSVKGIVYIPANFDAPGGTHDLPVYVDTTDPTSAGAISADLTQAGQQLSIQLQASSPAASANATATSVTLIFSSPYRNLLYIEFMAPGSLVQTVMFVSIIGGGITILNDRERGVIEGYLVTPLSRYDIVFGVLLAGVVKALFSAGVMFILAILFAGIHPNVGLSGAILMVLTLVLTAFGLLSMMTAIAVKMPNRDMLQFMVGPLNFIFYFTSGAIYPIQGFPTWMQEFSLVNPEAYAVTALRTLMYKGATLAGVIGDLTFLFVFTVTMVMLATIAFRRGL